MVNLHHGVDGFKFSLAFKRGIAAVGGAVWSTSPY